MSDFNTPLRIGANHIKGAMISLLRNFAGLSKEEAAKVGGLTVEHLTSMEVGTCKGIEEYNHMYGVYLERSESCRELHGHKSWEHWIHDLCACIRVNGAVRGFTLPDFVDTPLSIPSLEALGMLMHTALIEIHSAEVMTATGGLTNPSQAAGSTRPSVHLH